MNVRSSTRATSSGSERARYEFGRLASDRRSKVPLSTSAWQRSSYSRAEPSPQCTGSGLHLAANSSTQARSRSCFVGTVMSLAILWCQLLNVRRNDRGLCRAAGEAYISPRAVYATRASIKGASANALTTSIAPARRAAAPPAGGAPSRRGAGELEPDAGLVRVAVHAPAVGHLVHEHEAETARLERIGVLVALLRHLARAPRVADLDVRAYIAGAGAQADPLFGVHPRVTDAVGHELGHEQQERRLLRGAHEPAARHRMARLARRGPIRGDGQLDLRPGYGVAPHR